MNKGNHFIHNIMVIFVLVSDPLLGISLQVRKRDFIQRINAKQGDNTLIYIISKSFHHSKPFIIKVLTILSRKDKNRDRIPFSIYGDRHLPFKNFRIGRNDNTIRLHITIYFKQKSNKNHPCKDFICKFYFFRFFFQNILRKRLQWVIVIERKHLVYKLGG